MKSDKIHTARYNSPVIETVNSNTQTERGNYELKTKIVAGKLSPVSVLSLDGVTLSIYADDLRNISELLSAHADEVLDKEEEAK